MPPSYKNEPIAVIGSGCRFPGGSTSPSRLWDLLRDPRDVLRKIDRFRADNFYNTDGHHHGASNVLSAYLLAEDTKLFDTQFFNIPLSEAEAIDPQQRLLMETVYESLDTAGLSMESLSGSNTAVYVGVMCDDFSQIVYGDSENVPTYAATGSARSILSNRVSYFFNWHGPSMTIDTACSSSLIAVHQAVQVLRSGEAPVAVAAGTNLIFGPTMFVAESNLNMLSPTGRSQMWDANANGYARGEGVGSIVMKTLSAALRDGDHIEYIIRETGINQDGKTPGITMPSSSLQAALIRDTYARAGLDPSKRGERCQYFEAHGTGTPAGDPQEAGAIFKAFFSETDAKADGDEASEAGFEGENILYVGSIKTIVGHTEGTAGIAGLMKASLGIQHKMIPPNMFFNRLNPAIEPYYGNLKVPVDLQEWPQLPPGVPRRASVNSFGFGGANAHAIIESYEPASPAPVKALLPAASSPVPYPFVFSATSERSLAAQLRSMASFLDQNHDFDLCNLSWSLFKKTAFNFRISFSAHTAVELITKIHAALDEAEANKAALGVRVNPKTPRQILGVFTGQGAQWATMGRELVLSSHMAESVMDELEKSLAELPDGPDWSLKQELFAPKEQSRIAQAAFAQPLCTAVQIMVVDLLRKSSGVTFNTIVGHSSGEIGCAYAAGFLSARDAIRVAYYRGKFAKLAKAESGKPGAMIAAGTDMDDVNYFCNLPKLKGRAQLAASNSSASVTISGDADAIDLIEVVMKDESKFARKLLVDTAYHSRHMLPCGEPYMDALRRCDIQILTPSEDAPAWYTSVHADNQRVTMEMARELKTTYWRDNMVQPVLFSQALKAAVADGAPGLVLEVGPHPALKGPASLTIEEATSTDVPYFGTLARGKNDALALASSIGDIWATQGAAAGINLQGFLRAFIKDATFEVSKELPTYVWDHERVVWNETRISKAHRLRSHATHELLGAHSVDDVEGEHRWRNYLKPKEMPWLKGHQIQGQMVFPAAGFAVMALEAARTLAPFDTIRLMELQSFSIHKALSFMDENASIETIFSLANVQEEGPYKTADFACYACMNKDAGEFTSMASGVVKLTLGARAENALPERPRWVNNFVDTNVEFFYDSLATLGYGYTGMFQGVTELQRTNGGSKGTIVIPWDEDSAPQQWVIHPATLDVAFQAVFAAVGAPGDGRLWTMHVPTMIESITINPSVCEISSGVETPLPFDACLAQAEQGGIAGHVDLYDEDGKHAVVQVQNLHVTPLQKPTTADDRDTFAATTWAPAYADLVTDWTEWKYNNNEEKVASFAERLSLYIIRHLADTVTNESIEEGTEHQRAVLEWAQHVVETVRSEKHPTCPKQWLADTWEVLKAPAERLAKINPQVRHCLWVKQRLEPFVRGTLDIEDELRTTKAMESLYLGIPGFRAYNKRMAQLVDQLAFRHHNLRILEIGFDKGVTTEAVLKVLGDNVMSYTCTDLEKGNFDDIRARLPEDQAEKFVFKPLDIEQDPAEQGFTAGYYDLVIASNTLHRAPVLSDALAHARALLRPGGYLALLEPTSDRSLALGLSACLQPSWLAGIEEHRKFSPLCSQKTWDNLLRDSGFGGIDTATPPEHTFWVPYSVMCAAAVDAQMAVVRDPLAYAGEKKLDADLLIIGGQRIQTSRLVRGLTNLLSPFFNNVINFETLAEVDDETLASNPTTISLLELDEPLFKPFTEEKFKAIVKVCDSLSRMLWVTVGSRGENPYMNMMVGVGRCLVGEMPNLRLQFLNFDGADRPTPSAVAHHLLVLHLTHGFSNDSIKLHDPLFTNERELSVSNGVLLLPRYLPVEAINTRLNSDKRLITHHLDHTKTPVALDAAAAGYKLLERLQTETVDAAASVTVHVEKSLLNAIRIGGAGCLVPVLGSVGSGKKVVTISEGNQSIVTVARASAVEVDVADADAAGFLLHTAAGLLAVTILGSATAGAVLVHEPTAVLAASLKRLAAKMNKTLLMTSVSSDIAHVQQVHPSTTDRVLARVVPKGTTQFVDLSEAIESKGIGARLAKLLPLGCECKTSSHLFSPRAFATGSVDASRTLGPVVQEALASLDKPQSADHVVRASELAAQDLRPTGLVVVDWKADTTLPVSIVPADETIRFRSDRTYFMVGLTGELGLQLTKWMVQHGARYLALSSRNPSINAEWLEVVQAEGAVVKTYAMDVTSRESVHAVHKQVCAEMPPVAGVANGAMILIDGLFANKTHAEFDKTLRPKVQGTVYLDETFGQGDLDFFVVFSSLACVSGNMGQTAYAAANAFMCSLIAGRRMRGKAGSAINMPGIVGLGYLNRDPRKLDRLKNVGYVNISEWEFYQFLSEALVAGKPDSGMNPEITAGLQRIDMERNPNPPIWVNTPRFGWLQMVKPSGEASGGGDKDGSSVRSQLAELTNEEDIHKLLLDGLLNTLYSRLNMNPEERGITPDTAIVELGVDSLLAVDMRAWFTKELDLDMPVLKILGGATVNDLVDDAIKRLAPELVPNLKRGGETPAAEADAADTDENAASGDAVDAEESGETPVEAGPEAEEDTTPPVEITPAPEEEPLVIAPVDLPYFGDQEDHEDVVAAVAAWQTRDTLWPGASYLTPGSDIASFYGSASEDDQQSNGTPITSGSEIDAEEAKPDEEPEDEVEEIEMEEHVAQLHSHLPERLEHPLEFVKKTKMSYGTSRFWFLLQYLEDPTTFNIMCQLKISGPMRFDDCDRCITELGNRHEVFRTAFFADPERMNEPTMGVLKQSPLRLERRSATSEEEIQAEVDELLNYEFKLEQGETIRVKMISLDNDQTHHVIFGFHHIVIDGFSFNRLLPELNSLYDNEPLEPVETTFSDFATRQRLAVTSGSLDKELEFWKNMYSVKLPSGEVKPDYPEALPLFSVAQSPRRSLSNYEFNECQLTLDLRTVRQIKAQCRRHKITSFHFFLGALRTFLFRHVDVDDLVIGIADANRADRTLDTTVGFMLNLLPLRFRSKDQDKNTPFREIATQARDVAYSALAHSALPFDALLEKLDVPRSTTHSPLFQAWMDYRPFSSDKQLKLFGAEVDGHPTVGRNGYDLTLDVNEVAGSEIRLSFRTQKYLYSPEATTLLFDSYLRLVKAFAGSFDTHVDSVPLWSAKDVERATALGRGPQMQSEWPETLSHRITDIATQNPNAEALKDGSGATLTYKQLQSRVQVLSEALTKAGVGARSRVAVFQQPSADWVCSLLAIWHAGGTYIPLDLRNSLPRLAAIAKEARPAVIISHAATADQVPELASAATIVNASSLADVEPKQNTPTQAKAAAAAAILFTSGSTGTPKGVVLRHANFKNTIEGLTRTYEMGAERVLQQSAFTFDFSLDQILCGLVNAGSVYVVSAEARADPVAICKIIAAEGVTYTRATPSEYANWLTYGAADLMQATKWKMAFGGGETMPPSLRENIAGLGLDVKLFNSYGPAEAITCTKSEVQENLNEEGEPQEVPAGFPLPNYSVYIVDRRLQIVPQGVAGEILIGGASVGAGYLNNEKLTESKFISNTYAPADGRLVYRTGDVGRLRADGALMFTGRIAGDTQVKIRGIRIELEEIENSILATAGGALSQAVVTVRGEMLVAHVQFAAGHYDDEQEQKAFLRNLRFMLPLPVYMMPAVFVALEQMPVNAHGKTDRAAVKALPLPQANRGRTGEALSETERKLVEVWKEVIGDAEATGAVEVSDQASFFEFGGNSLLLVKLQILISMRFHAKLSLVDLLGAASLGAMAARIDTAPPADFIDWAAETQLDDDLMGLVEATTAGSSMPAVQDEKKTGHKTVVVTGATGFLGRRLVARLVADESVAEIHCVAVRPNSKHRDALPASDKVRVHAGDLAAPRLGLSEEAFKQLAYHADVIVHAGVSRSFMDAYQMLRGPNFEATKTLVRLATPRHVPIHFLSSGSVASLVKDDATPPTAGAEGYLAAKWASEQYLGHAAAALGLPVAIHRVVAAAAADEAANAAVLAELQALAAKLNSVPAPGGWKVALDLTPADDLAQRVVAAATSQPAAEASAAPRVSEYAAHTTVDMGDMVPHVADGANAALPTLPAMQWLARARDAGFGWQIASLDNAPFGDAEAARA